MNASDEGLFSVFYCAASISVPTYLTNSMGISGLSEYVEFSHFTVKDSVKYIVTEIGWPIKTKRWIRSNSALLCAIMAYYFHQTPMDCHHRLKIISHI